MIPSQEEYVIFNHKPKAKFTDFDEVRKEIVEETNRHLVEKRLTNAGASEFSSDPISLKIYSPNVLKLTVVDLPGLIRDVEDGQDPSNIIEVRNMVLEYIRPKESLILAVTPATQDIVTSDAMEIAKEVDPKRERTIGVITKVDELSEGNDCLDVLDNSRIFLQKGYVGVINRNQSQINEGKDFNYILQREKEYFANHPAYRHMKNVMGTPYLKKMLQKTLRLHIKQYLPKKRSEISAQLSDLQRSLRNFEKKMGERLKDGKNYIIKLLLSFIRRVTIDVYGNSELVDDKKITAGAMIGFKLATEVKRNLTLSLMPDEDQTSIIIINMLGMRTHVGLPAPAIEAINGLLLEKYKTPVEESVNCIKLVLKYSISQCAKMMDHYNTLKEDVIFKINECIDKEAENTVDRLIAHVDVNKFFINFHHPNFNSSECDDLAPITAPMKLWGNVSDIDIPVDNAEGEDLPVGIPSTKEMMTILKQTESFQNNVKYVTTLLKEILKHAQVQMLDTTVKYIPNFLVKKVVDFISEDLLIILQSSNFDKFTEDCEADFHWKEETENICKILQETLQAIEDF